MTKAEALSKVEGLLSDLFPIEEHDKVEEIIKALEQLLKTGHWTEDGYCSCCGEESYPYDLSGYGSYYHNYCPNCGAKMSEGDNET